MGNPLKIDDMRHLELQVLRNSKPISSRAAPSGVAALRLSDEKQEGSQYVKLEKTQTSWTGWGNSGNEKKVTEVSALRFNPFPWAMHDQWLDQFLKRRIFTIFDRNVGDRS